MGVSRIFGKLFGAGEKEAVLRAYGKLPFYAEYRRLEVSTGLPTQFSQWLDAGRLAWMRTGEQDSASMSRSVRMFLRFPEQRDAVIACVWDSRDSLGRRFPFAFFVTCSPDALGENAIERWGAIAAIHRTLDRTYGEVHALGAGGDFYKRFQKRLITLRADDHAERAASLRNEAEQLSAESWVADLPSSDTENAALERHAALADIARRIRRWKEAPATLTDVGLALPLAKEIPANPQIAIWITLFEQLAPDLPHPPSAILASEEHAEFSLLIRALMPEDFALMTSDARIYGFVEHVGSGQTDADFPPPSGPLATWLLSLADSAPTTD